MGWTYWALNGEDSYDLLDSNYDPTPASALKQSLLQTIQFPLPGAENGTPPPTGTAAPVSCQAGYSLTNCWAGGFQAQIVLTNTGTERDQPVDAGVHVRRRPADRQPVERDATPSPASRSRSPPGPTTPRSQRAARSRSASPARYTSSDAAPTGFSVNGTACTT